MIAPSYTDEALEILRRKKNRIILVQKQPLGTGKQVRSCLNGYLVQDRDTKSETEADMRQVSKKALTDTEISDLIFAVKLVKHSKSNAIVLAKNGQLLASGVGQTSRVDALKHAIEKAGTFGFDLNGAVMAQTHSSHSPTAFRSPVRPASRRSFTPEDQYVTKSRSTGVTTTTWQWP